MKVRILSPWKQGSKHQELEENYLKRLKRYTTIEIEEIKGVKGEDRQATQREGEKILSHIKGSPFIVALTENGKAYDSVGFSRWLEKLTIQGKSDITFVIGGAAGLHEAVIKTSHFNLSLSPMTFPHRLTRVILIEQIYRALTLIKGEPYHK